MLRTTAGRLMVDEALPADMRRRDRVLDAKGTKELLQEVAEKHPDQYRQIVKALSDVGREISYASGGFSFGLRHLRPSKAFAIARQQMEQEIDAIDEGEDDDDTKERRIIEAVHRQQEPLQKAIYEETLADRNPLGEQVLSGSRGKPMNLKSLLGSDGLYNDHRGRIIPIPVLNSYSRGLTPSEYYAGTFGARSGVVDVKMATQDAGYFSKQLIQAAHRLLVTRFDSDQPYDEKSPRGLPVDPSDGDSAGALLSLPVGGYPRNTLLTPKILKHLAGSGVKRILVRSPLVGGPPEGGLYGRDVGVRERGGIAPVGDEVGIAAAGAISEPVSQGGLNQKHTGGVVGASKVVSGFNFLNQLIQVPKAFPGGAAHSEVDGRVQGVSAAPAGGQYVTVGSTRHYVAPGFAINVKPGDEVEAGDVLSEGIPNPAKIVEHKGVGEGRRYFVDAFRSALKESGLGADRRNIELVARGLINHVRLDDDVGEYGPDDIVQYDQLEHSWEPRPGSRLVDSRSAVGKYLEKPLLHYSIGTKLTRRVLQDLDEFGVNTVQVHDDPPPFHPEMVRGMENLQHDPDWLTRMLGSNIQKGLEKGVHRGDVSNSKGTSYVPALADDPINFGRTGLVRGFKPESIVKPAPTPAPTGSVLEGL